MKSRRALIASALVASTVLVGCASPSQPLTQSYPTSGVASNPSYGSSYGVVDSIQRVNTASGSSGIGAGAVVGGVVGGLLGNQVGDGRGRTAATAVGAVGGALAGNEIQKRNNATQGNAYQVNVRLDNGSVQSVTQDSIADIGVGNRVRIENGRAYRY